MLISWLLIIAAGHGTGPALQDQLASAANPQHWKGKSMSDPLVSVIIPVYNGERYILEAIASILAQTYQQFELLVVDDSSTDGTAARVNSVQSSKMLYIRQAHHGAGAARNTGVARSSGQFLAFLDADDMWPVDKLSLQVEMLARRSDLDLVFGHYTEFVSPELAPVAQADTDPLPAYSSGTMLIRREAYNRVGDFPNQWRVGEFLDWYSRAMDLRLRTAMMQQVMLRRRIHDGNTGADKRESRQTYAAVVSNIIQRRRTSGTEAK